MKLNKILLSVALAATAMGANALTVADMVTPGAKFVTSPNVPCDVFLAAHRNELHPMYGPAVMGGRGITVGIMLEGGSRYISGCLYTSGRNNVGNIGWSADGSVSPGRNGKPLVTMTDEEREAKQQEQDARRAEQWQIDKAKMAAQEEEKRQRWEQKQADDQLVARQNEQARQEQQQANVGVAIGNVILGVALGALIHH